MWTAALTVTGLGGLWLVARHWQGWILYLINEVLWLAYGLTIRSTPVIVMAVLWFITGTRNLVVQRALSRTSNLPEVRAEVQLLRPAVGDVAEGLSSLREPLPTDRLIREELTRQRDAFADERERSFWHPY